MLNFRNANIFFGVLLAFLVGFDLVYRLPAWVYPALCALYLLLIFYGSYFVGSGFFINVICSANTDKKEIAISFDDGPVKSYTPAIMQVLKENNIKTAFFCIGSRIAGNEKLFQQLHEEGHLIGNHSYSHHIWFDFFSSKKMLEDLRMMDEVMEKATGLKPLLFRPPFGVTNPSLRKAITNGKYIPVGWSIRSMDTVITNEKRLLHKVIRSIKPGAIVLFHDTSKTTLAILPDFIRHLTVKGYEIVRLDKMLKLNAYA